jgi:integron integrase
MPLSEVVDGRNEKPRLLDQVRDAIRVRHLSIRTEQAYVDWIRRFIIFHQKRHPREMGKCEITRFLTWLATHRRVAASTQNQALCALLFLYRHVLEQNFPWLDDPVWAKTPERIPVVLSSLEVSSLLTAMSGLRRMQASLLYGTGMRLLEGLRLRVQDLDFDKNEIRVRRAKGGKDRVTVFPAPLRRPLRDHLEGVRQVHVRDLREGYGRVFLPDALERKYPNAAAEWPWQWVFPSSRRSIDPRAGVERRHHQDESGLQKAIRQAARAANIGKLVGPHTLRHSFATELLASGYDIRTIQKLLGHKSVETTMIYTHVLNSGPGVRSPLEALGELFPDHLPP